MLKDLAKTVSAFLLGIYNRLAGTKFAKWLHSWIVSPLQWLAAITGIGIVTRFIWKEIVEFVDWTQTVDAIDKETGEVIDEFDAKHFVQTRATSMGRYKIKRSRIRASCLPLLVIVAITLTLGGAATAATLWKLGWEEVMTESTEEGYVQYIYHWRFWGHDFDPHRKVRSHKEVMVEALGGQEQVQKLKDEFGGQGIKFVPRNIERNLRRDKEVNLDDLPDGSMNNEND